MHKEAKLPYGYVHLGANTVDEFCANLLIMLSEVLAGVYFSAFTNLEMCILMSMVSLCC